MNDFSRLLGQFAEVLEDPGGYLVPCTAHDDHSPSLYLTLKDDGRLLVYCRAGCDRGDVLAAMPGGPMDERDLFGWVPGDTARMVTGGTSLPGPGYAETAGLRVWLDGCVARWGLPTYAEMSADAADYLMRRFGVDATTAEALGIGLSPRDARYPFAYISPRFRRFPRIVVPLAGFDGVARGAQGRDISGECEARWVSLSNRCAPADSSPVGWAKYGVLRGGGDLHGPDDPDVYVITEGPGDGLTVAALGFTAVAVRGASIAANKAMVDEIANGVRGASVVIAADNDDAGRKFTASLGAALRERGVTASHLVIPHAGDDVTAWRERDPDAFPAEFHRAMGEAKPIEPEPLAVPEPAPAPAVIGTPGVVPYPELLPLDYEAPSAKNPGRFGGNLIDASAYAEHVAAHNADAIKLVRGFGWFHWTGTHWVPSAEQHAVPFHAIQELRKVWRAQGLGDYARVLGVGKHRKDIAEQLRYLPELTAEAAALNACPRIPFRNGTYDPRTGVFHPGEWFPEDMRTACVNARFDPSAPRTRWARFMSEVFPDDTETPAHVAVMLGRVLTGDTRRHVFGTWYGHKGRNGKGTIVRLMKYLLGEPAVYEPDVDIFARRGQRHGEQMYKLALAWLVVANETSEGVSMDNELIKRLSGDDSLTFRRLYSGETSYRPRFTLVFTTNHRPQFDGTDEALWARNRAVEFAVSFLGREDVDLDDTLQAEADGIATALALAAARYINDGVPETESTRRAAAAHRAETNVLDLLEGEVFDFDPDGHFPRSEFNARLKAWREDNGETRARRSSPTQVARQLEAVGVTPRKVRGIYRYAGIVPAGSAKNPANTPNAEAHDIPVGGSRIFEQ